MKKNNNGSDEHGAQPETLAGVAAIADQDPAVTAQLAAATQRAMQLLQWEPRDLFLNTLAFGSVGTEADLVEHLRTGDHVTPGQAAVIHATLNDALRDIGSAFRV